MSFKGIAKYLGVSPGSAHLWAKDVPLSSEDTARLASNGHQNARFARKTKRVNQALRILEDRREAEILWESLKKDPLFLFGLALYIGEGYKTESAIGMTSSDPGMLRMALRFFDKIGCDMERIKGGILLHKGEDPQKALDYWSEQLSLPIRRFNKVTASKVSGGVRARHLVHGTARVRVGNARVKRKLKRWMELAQNKMGASIDQKDGDLQLRLQVE